MLHFSLLWELPCCKSLLDLGFFFFFRFLLMAATSKKNYLKCLLILLLNYGRMILVMKERKQSIMLNKREASLSHWLNQLKHKRSNYTINLVTENGHILISDPVSIPNLQVNSSCAVLSTASSECTTVIICS